MIDRQWAGLLPAKPHTVLRAPDGKIVHEEMLTRAGFAGAFGSFYHRFPVGAHRAVTPSARGWAPPGAPALARGAEDPSVEDARLAAFPLRRRLYQSGLVDEGGMLLDRRVPVLFNDDLTILLARPSATDDAYFANGDGDELWFLQEGAGRVESPCGWLVASTGDYVWIPKSMVHRWHVDVPMRLLGVEARGGVSLPPAYRNGVGQLRMDAPYTHRDFVRPLGPISTFDAVQDGPRELVVKKRGAFTSFALEHPAMDVVGWDGFVYPFALAIEKFSPKTGAVHLPPTVHATFEGPGFLVSSFVPRMLDYGPGAIPCPYPHSNVDCDEVILYLRGNFTSRRGVGPGAISLHPSGIAHGPHPGAYEASVGATRTEELAVMCDTFAPLVPASGAAALEEPGYHDSWRS